MRKQLHMIPYICISAYFIGGYDSSSLLAQSAEFGELRFFAENNEPINEKVWRKADLPYQTFYLELED